MKKIGLAVCYDTKNFGSQLQVLATIKKIEELGYTPEIIKYKKKMSFKLILQTLPRFFNIYFLRGKINRLKKNRGIKKDKEAYESIKTINSRYKKFMNEKFRSYLKTYNGWKNLVVNSNKDYDAFLCGSDQLWLPNNLGSHFYTLEFVKDKPRIAYATSFGVSNIPWYQKKSTAKYLSKFQALSSRETRGVEIIKELTNRYANVVCDPTMMLSNEEWLKIAPNKKIINEKYIFCYFLGNNIEHRKAAEQLAKEKKLKIVSIPFLNNYVKYDKQFADINIYDIDSFDFINLIRNAEYVLTDSFHGSVFSTINHKKFIVFNRFDNNSKDSRNSRIDSLCKTLNLSDRRYNGEINAIDNEIDYKTIDRQLSKFRKESIEYLKTALDSNIK